MLTRRVLWERYRDLGLGKEHPAPRPVIGSMHVAGGFVIPALLGAEIIFAADAAPQPRPMNLTVAQIEAFVEHGTPDDNIYALFEVVERYRGYGA